MPTQRLAKLKKSPNKFFLLYILLMLNFNIFNTNQTSKHIFFDMGHVLVRPAISTLLWQIGPKNILNYIFYYRRPVYRKFVQQKLFAYINYCSNLPTHDSLKFDGEYVPNFLYLWITGQKNSSELLDYLKNHPAQESFFDSVAERDLILASLNILNPEINVDMHQAMPGMINLLKKCAQKYPGHVYILSNWDESCMLLKAKFPEIFAAVPETNIIFSHDVHCAKPEHTFFDLITKRFGIASADCILIDDMPENIASFQAWGGCGILHKDFKNTRAKLFKLLNEKRSNL
jgi:HAD superfamily hydrolase (TIGR01509 family)